MSGGTSGQPTGTVTFLFTDLEGSTRLWEEHPDEMHDALARHDQILRDTVERSGGYVVKSTGDGIHAAFATAGAAASAAIAQQRALAATSWDATGPLRIRAGLHTGSAEVRDGDYFGPALNRAARLMAAAHGGQVVCSEVTADILRDEGDGSADVIDLGEHLLRDLARPERVFQLVAPGLDRDFPPLQTADAHPGNLPAQTTSFVGRTTDLDELDQLVQSASVVTLTGVGGVGKTRLAIEAAALAATRHRDGAWLCELAVADDPDSLLQVVAGALGAGSRPGMSAIEGIVDFLRIKDLLLVLDNCEHVLDAVCDLVEAIEAGCSGVTVLATSREALGVTGEHVVRVRSLATPQQHSTADELLASESVHLFIERASATGATLHLDDGDLDTVAEICRRLDGIPLAIELAAARASVMQPSDIAARLGERFRLLTGRRRGAMERHHALRATVDWSYSLLSDDERAVFDRLSVFPGTFDADAAVAIARGPTSDRMGVLDALDSLVAKSMLNAERGRTGATRYQMLETIRQYARERLEERGESDTRRRVHAQHFAELAEQMGTGLQGRDEARWRHRLAEEHDSLRAAVGWALDRDRSEERELALRVIAALELEANAGEEYEIDTWAERALPMLGEARAVLRAFVVTAAGWGALGRGDIEQARARAEAAIGETVAGRHVAPGNAYTLLGLARLIGGDFEGSLQTIVDGLAEFEQRTTRPPADDVMLRTALPSFHAIVGNLDEARGLGEVALERARALGSPSAISAALIPLVVATMRSDPAYARELVDESVALVRRFEARGAVHGYALGMRAQLLADSGDHDGAVVDLRDAVATSHDRGDRPMLALVFDRGSLAMAAVGEPEVAVLFAGIGRSTAFAGLSSMPRWEQAWETTARDAVASSLGPERYDALFGAARALSYDDAVTTALAELDRLLAEPVSG